MAKVKKFELEKKYVDYFNSVRDELVKAEDTVSRIKGSKEWKKAYDYFSVCKHRGLIKTRPTKANGYRIELSDGTIQIEELEDIVTPEQMEQIKKLKRINLKE